MIMRASGGSTGHYAQSSRPVERRIFVQAWSGAREMDETPHHNQTQGKIQGPSSRKIVSPERILHVKMTMVAIVIKELKFVSRLKIFLT